MSQSKYSLKTAQDLANSHEGECLSSEYIHVKYPLHWRCFKGHEWKKNLYTIKSGTWCLQCSWDNRKIGLPVAKEIAISKGDECLSENYVNNNSPLI